MKNLQIRLLSAAFALALLFGLIFYFGQMGLFIMSVIVVALATREGSRLFFAKGPARLLEHLFSALTISLFVFGVYFFDQVAVAYGLAVVVFFSTSLFLRNKFADLELLAKFQSRSILGFFYLALLPTLAVRLLHFEKGTVWFLALLAFVFANDTFAYLAGSLRGRRKLMPEISPKKSLEGSLGGLFGSALSAIFIGPFIPQVPLYVLIFLALVVGVAGQLGDLFESLLKRVANQKDSGSLLPGHGGILDRIDGVLFAAPVMYLGCSLINQWF